MCRAMEKIGNEIWAEAHAEGHAEGAAEYADKIAKLSKVLTEKGRVDDLMRAIVDRAFAETLFKEFGI